MKYKKLNVNLTDQDGNSALNLAAAEGHHLIVEALLNDKRTDISVVNNVGENALQCSAQSSTIEAMKYILSTKRYDENYQDEEGHNLLHYAACNKNPEFLEYVLQNTSIDINSLSKSNQTPMMAAILHECEDNAIRLIDSNLSLVDSENECVLHMACDEEMQTLVGEILKRRPDLVRNRTNVFLTPLHVACMKTNIEIIKMIIGTEGVEINAIDAQGRTPFHHACLQGKKPILIYLINYPGLELDIKDEMVNFVFLEFIF